MNTERTEERETLCADRRCPKDSAHTQGAPGCYFARSLPQAGEGVERELDADDELLVQRAWDTYQARAAFYDELVKHMTQRFLSWKLPENFNPDGGITAKRPNYAPNIAWEPTGTNLLDYTQAEAMVRHMLEGAALPPAGRVEELETALGQCVLGFEKHARLWADSAKRTDLIEDRLRSENATALAAQARAALNGSGQ